VPGAAIRRAFSHQDTARSPHRRFAHQSLILRQEITSQRGYIRWCAKLLERWEKFGCVSEDGLRSVARRSLQIVTHGHQFRVPRQV
jgi:hypothetical protein